MPTFRCYLCPGPKGIPGLDFTADKPVCPTCGVDPGADPRDAGVVVKLQVIHFDPPRRPGRGYGHAACDPKLKVGAGGVVATGEPSVVNCPACRGTDAWKAVDSGEPQPAAGMPSGDMIVNIDREKMTITAPPDEG